jgi:hypothetical protein
MKGVVGTKEGGSQRGRGKGGRRPRRQAGGMRGEEGGRPGGVRSEEGGKQEGKEQRMGAGG